MSNINRLKEFLENKYQGHDFKFKGNDRRIIGLCPEHDDHNPSFNIYEYNGKAYYKCFSCGFKGSLYDFTIGELTPEQKEIYENNKRIQDILSDSFKYFKDYLFNGDTIEAVSARKYLTETRFLDINKIKKCDIGLIKINEEYNEIDELLEPLSNGKPNKLEYYHGYLVFAHTDATGNICLLRFRSPDGNKEIKTAKIKGFSDRSYAFNLSLVGKSDAGKFPLTPYIYIAEGEFNSLTYISQTHNYNICSAGPKDNVKTELINSILQLKYKPVIALDQDKAGQDRLKKLYPEIKNNKQVIYCEYDSKDFDDLFKNKSDEGVNIAFCNIRHNIINKLEEKIIQEKLLEKDKTVKNIDKFILNDSLKEIYLREIGEYIKEEIKQAVNLIIKDKKAIDSFGLPVELGSIGALAGATGTGKTEFMMEIADNFAKQNEKHLALLCQYEGSEEHIQQRLALKHINNPNLFYAIKPTTEIIERFVRNHNDKKIFIVIDYLQKMARTMRSIDKSKNRTENNGLAVYTDFIFENFDNLRNKYNNICIYFLSSFSKQGINEIKTGLLPDPLVIANAVKESGDISYDVDFGFSLFFADEKEKDENKWSIGRKIKDKYRKYMLLYGFKDSRINGELNNNIYVFNPESRRYDMVPISQKITVNNNIKTLKQAYEQESDNWAQ